MGRFSFVGLVREPSSFQESSSGPCFSSILLLLLLLHYYYYYSYYSYYSSTVLADQEVEIRGAQWGGRGGDPPSQDSWALRRLYRTPDPSLVSLVFYYYYYYYYYYYSYYSYYYSSTVLADQEVEIRGAPSQDCWAL